jgi:phosphatidylserine decarboxylase
VSFAREGLVFIAIAALIAAGTYALALNRRSWPLWLLAFLLTIIALWVAYFFRDPERTGERGDQVVIAPADGKVVLIEDVDIACRSS